jgi:O-antigen chain-terminating methyltransferase
VLILETPSPLSVVMAARNFWIDPTHQRPVHPASLEVTFREAGFEPVHRLDLHPFPEDERLPEIDVSRLAADQRDLADQVNRLRDLLDDLLFGARDFGMVGVKP